MHYDQEDALVSVIVPIYKVEPYLRECVDSIIGQTYKNLEIILVDDGSPDNCGAICEEYAKHDSRITVYHKENGGLSDARNYGIDRCHGEYITFVDSDDYLKSNFVKTLVELLEKNDADIAESPVQLFRDEDSSSRILDSKINNGQISIFTSKEALRLMLYQEKDGIGCGAHNTLCKSILFSDIRYPVGMLTEDLGTTYKVLMKSGKVVLACERMYYYRVRGDSLLHQTYSPKMITCIFTTSNLYNDISKQYPDLKAAAASRAFSANRGTYLLLPYDKKDDRMKLWAEMKKYRKTVLFDPHARKLERIMALLTYLGPVLFHRLLSKTYRKYLMNK